MEEKSKENIKQTLQQEKEMLELFQVEELEKRYEMGWLRVIVGGEQGTHGVDVQSGKLEPVQ